MQKIEVEIYKAVLVIEERRVPLTLKIAKQFPVDFQIRPRQAETCKPKNNDVVVCKVPGPVLGYDSYQWLYLVTTENGLAWHAPAHYVPRVAERIVKLGGWVDNPEEVPTIIL